MKYERYYIHEISKDIMSESEWKEVARNEGWSYEMALEYDFLTPAYTKATSDFGLDLFFGALQ